VTPPRSPSRRVAATTRTAHCAPLWTVRVITSEPEQGSPAASPAQPGPAADALRAEAAERKMWEAQPARGGGGGGALRARLQCRFVPPLIHFVPCLLTYSVTLHLKRNESEP
jgi:hypothetical protein